MSIVRNDTDQPVSVPVCPPDHAEGDSCSRVELAPGAILIFSDGESNGDEIAAATAELGLTPLEL